MVQKNELTAEDIIAFVKASHPDDEVAQVNLFKSVYKDASYGKTVKESIADSNGASHRTATQARTMAQPGAPGANVGQIDDPDEIQRRFRDEDVASEEYNKGSEVEEEEDEKKSSKKASKKGQMPDKYDGDEDDDGQDDDDGQFMRPGEMEDSDGDGEEDEEDPRQKMKSSKKSTTTKKSNASTYEDYENKVYDRLLNKGGNPDEIGEVIDAAPVVQQLAEVTAEGNATINVKLDRVTKSMGQLISLVKSQATKIEAQDAKIEALRTKLAKNHNKVIDFVEKSFSDYGEPMAKSQSASPVQEEVIVKSATPRPVINGAIAVIGGDSVEMKKSGRLSGDYKRDKRMLTKSLTNAAEEGHEGAIDILAEIDLVPQNYPQGFEGIVAKMDAGWLKD